MVRIDRERLISEKQNNKASTKGARLPKGAMLLRDFFKYTKPSLDAFRPLDSSAGLAKGQEIPPIALRLTFIKQTNTLVCYIAHPNRHVTSARYHLTITHGESPTQFFGRVCTITVLDLTDFWLVNITISFDQSCML